MKTIVIVVMAVLGLALLSLILVAAFFVPVEQSQNDTDIPTATVEVLDALPEGITLEFTLQTIAENGKLAYIGIGGEIDGIVNPDLNVKQGDVVRIVLLNGDGMPHDLFIPDFKTGTEYISKIGDKTEIIFEVGGKQPGEYVYYCTVTGHRKAGQEGKLIVASAEP